MKTYLLALPVVGLLCSCATLSSDVDGGPYGPESAKGSPKKGRAMYNPDGITEIVKRRREDALRQIFEFCNNSQKYKIIKDYRSKVSDINEPDTLSTFGADEVQVIEFECTK